MPYLWLLDPNDKRNIQKDLKKLNLFPRIWTSKYKNDKSYTSRLYQEDKRIYTLSLALHRSLATLANRNGGKLLAEQQIGELLRNGSLSFTSLKRLKDKRIKEIIHRGRNKLTFIEKTGTSVDEDTSLEPEVIDELLELIEANNEFNFESLRFIRITHRLFDRNIPNYMKQLYKYLNIESYSLEQIQSPEYAPLSIFKKPFIIGSLSTTIPKKLSRYEFFLSTTNGKAAEFKEFDVSKDSATIVELSLNGNYLKLIINASSHLLNLTTGTCLKDVTDNIFDLIIPIEPSQMIKTSLYKVVRYQSCPQSVLRYGAESILQRLHRELNDADRRVVTAVFCGYKGIGKSRFLSKMTEILPKVSIPERQCYYIDSDAFGRARATISTKDELKQLTFDDILKFNDVKLENYYETCVKKILVEEFNDPSINDYVNMGFSRKEKLFSRIDSIMHPFLIDKGMDKELMTEVDFYTYINAICPVPSCLLLGTHTTSRDAAMGPTDITMNFTTGADPYVSLSLRPDPVMHLALFHYYYREISYVHSEVSSYEFRLFMDNADQH